MSTNGKNKGSAFERKIANQLSKRFQLKTGISTAFRRNIDSGSFFGGSNQRRTTTHDLDYAVFGDLVCPKLFKFSIECKHYKSAPSFQSIMSHKVTQWDGWLKQALQDAAQAKKLMALIVKYNNVDEIVFVQLQLPIAANTLQYREFVIYKLDDFLKCDDDYYFSPGDQDSSSGSQCSGPNSNVSAKGSTADVSKPAGTEL
jgi:hypothetical protein